MTAVLQGPPTQRGSEDTEPSTTDGTTLATSRFADVAKLMKERERLRQLQELYADPVFEEVPDSDEREADHQVNRDLRAARRKQRRKAGLAAVDAEASHQAQKAKLDKEDRTEQLNLRKAQRKRRQLTDGGAHLVAMHRQYKAVSGGLAAVTIGASIWAAYNVAHSIGGSNPSLGHYFYEPIITSPLVAIIVMQIAGALSGRLERLRPFRKRQIGRMSVPLPTLTGVIELGLLASTVLVSVYPVWGGTFPEIAKAVCPALVVVVSVLLQLVAAELYGEIIREAWLRGDDSDANMRERARRGNELARLVQVAMNDRTNPMPRQEDGLPSISAIQKRFPCEKLIAQCAHDALAMWLSNDVKGRA